MNRTKLILAALALLFGGMRQAKAGPISAWYLTAGDQGLNWIIQGNTATSFAQNQPAGAGEYAIAVGNTVRTLHNAGAGLGSEYTLSGQYTGVNYNYPAAGTIFFDGTRDASHNYAVDVLTGNVYQMNLDWSNPVELFSTLGRGTAGITYDATNNSLWVSQLTVATVADFSLTGTLLSSFSPTFAGSSLALDPADGTLWMGSQATEGTFYQYSTSGNLLSTATYANMVNQNTLGGEFAFSVPAGTSTPEPASVTLLGIGAAGLVGYGWRRRRRTA